MVRIETTNGSDMVVCLARRRGLAITRGATGVKWTVTHLPSGRRVQALAGSSLKQAKAALWLLTALGDWQTIAPGVPPPTLADAISALTEMVDA